jgi:RNA polymerase sigma-70 factor, ECF subfamily
MESFAALLTQFFFFNNIKLGVHGVIWWVSNLPIRFSAYRESGLVLPKHRNFNDSVTTVDQTTPAVHEIQLSNEAVLALLKKIEDGDHSALTALYDKTNRLLYGLVLRILGDRTSAEEALLDVYTHIWKEPAFRDPVLSPLEWLTTIARSGAMARLHWNKQLKRKSAFQARILDPAMTVAPDRQELARHSLASLVPAQQEILGWAYYSGLSCSEIAVQIGKPVGAVKTHARLGLNKLSDLFHPFLERETQAGNTTGGGQ